MVKSVTIFIVLLVLAVSGSLGIYKSVSTPKQNEDFRKSPDRGSLKWVARKAKSEGKKTAVISAPIVDYLGGEDDPEFVLSNYSFVVARPVKSETVTTDSKIVTWYKFKLLQAVKQRPPLFNSSTSTAIPQEFLPLNDDEFVLVTNGGSVNIDDVNITMQDSELPPFTVDKQYFLIVSKSPTGFASLWAGPTGVFTILPDESMVPINQREHPIKDFVRTQFGNSLGQFKQRLSKE